ncbi:MAG: Asp-tRNA(Asn)/Glu-tRNA(Gln) amidotransferase subunit GatA [Gemmatimonadota bacterium]
MIRTIDEARSLLAGGSTGRDLLERAAARQAELESEDPALNAFLSTIEPESQLGSGQEAGPLAGVPYAVKDNICTPDLPTTCGSLILEGYRSPFSATAVARLDAAGARLFGKTNCDEFAMGSSTENSAFGPSRNPFDRDRVPGGSSGGSAAAVAAGVVPFALGSETGGSVRQPASFCGLVGLKPSYGRVSRYGLVAFASSLDQIGILTRGVRDAGQVLEIISGPDPRDATCQDRPLPRAAALDGVQLDGQVIGVPEEYLGFGLDGEVRQAFDAALGQLEQAGARIREVSLPSAPSAIPCYYVIAPAEASSNLARYDGVRYGFRDGSGAGLEDLYSRTRAGGFGAEVKRRIMLGTFALSAGYFDEYYGRALLVRQAIANDFERVFDSGVDALFTPTTPTPAFRLGEKIANPYDMYLSDVYTVSANLAGLPAVSVPIGNIGGLPVGAQFMAPRFTEETMLGLAVRLEELVGYAPPDVDGAAA